MSHKVYVATRKGLFMVTGDSKTGWSIGSPSFLGDPVTLVLDDQRDGTLYAALNLGHFGVKLHRSEDNGKSWNECAAPKFASAPASEAGLDATPASPSVNLIWALETGGVDEKGLLWAGTIPGGLFRSTDRGDSWELIRSLWDRPERANWFGGGYDEPGIHSVLVDPRDPKHLTVGVSCGGVWVTHDAAKTWECRTEGMYAEYMPPERRTDPSIQDPHRIAACAASPDVLWVQHHNGAFRSTDGGKSWTDLPVPPSKFGFAVAAHPLEPGTAWFVPAVKDDCRVPVDGKVVVTRTRDGGAHFDVLRNGLPQENAYDLVYRHALDIDSGGDALAMGSTTGGLWITEDGGDHWQTISTQLPPVYQVRFSAS